MKRSIIIGNADFSKNSLRAQCLLAGALTIGVQTQIAGLRDSPTQATVILHKEGMQNNKWRVENPDFSQKANYALNDIPFGAKSIKASDTVKAISISICLYDADYKALYTAVWATNYIQEINIANYPTAVYYSLNYQYRPADISTLSIDFTF